jgi:hypothetical protein
VRAWLAAPLAAATVALAASLAFLLAGRAIQVALALGGLALLLPILWVIVSAMRPAMPDRRCPRCGAEALVLFEPGNKVGARCRACGFADAELYVPFLADVMDDPDVAGPGAPRG